MACATEVETKRSSTTAKAANATRGFATMECFLVMRYFEVISEPLGYSLFFDQIRHWQEANYQKQITCA